MAHVIADRVSDVSVTTGAGDFSVSGSAPTGFRTLSSVLTNGDTFYYAIANQAGNEWEVGRGTFGSSNTFARTSVIASTNSNNAVSFSAGTKDVFLVQPAARDNPRLAGLTDNRLVRFDGTDGNLQQSGIGIDDSDVMTGIGALQLVTGGALRSAQSDTNTLLLQVYDLNDTTYRTAVRLTVGNTPTFELVDLDLDFNGRNARFDDATGILDDSGNEQLIFQKTASAVVNWEMTNAATGNKPLLAVVGDDTNIIGRIDGKGTGGVEVKGTSTNDDATSGYVGQVIESEILVGAAVSLTNSTAANVTSISLSAGDWVVWANGLFVSSPGTTLTTVAVGVNTTSATLPTEPAKGGIILYQQPFQTGASQVVGTVQRRFSVSTTTPVYLVVLAVFGGTLGGAGYIGARRVR